MPKLTTHRPERHKREVRPPKETLDTHVEKEGEGETERERGREREREREREGERRNERRREGGVAIWEGDKEGAR